MAGVPAAVAGVPAVLAGAPAVLAGVLAAAAGVPAAIAGAPAAVADAPAAAAGVPVAVVETPSGAAGHPGEVDIAKKPEPMRCCPSLPLACPISKKNRQGQMQQEQPADVEMKHIIDQLEITSAIYE